MKQRICVVDTVYSLMLYLLKFGYDESDLFVVSTGIPEDIAKNINPYIFPKPEFYYSRKKDRFATFNKKTTIPNLKHIWRLHKLKLWLLLKTLNRDVEVYGQGHLKFSFPLYKWPNNAIIEDGLSNYYSDLKMPYEFKHPKFAHFFGFYFKFYREGYGTHKNIKKIYLTGTGYSKLIEDKVEIIDPKSLWDMKSDEEKNQILDIFNLKEIVGMFSDDCVILITQALSEDKLLSFEEELDIYRQFVDKYPNIIIKPHPRENKNYHELFSGVTVIDTPFPMELLKFVGVKISKIVTISSTVAVNFKDECEIEIYEGETSSKIINDAIKLIREKLE